jgi:hypothetical protein
LKRAVGRARLFAEGELGLHDAVDDLQDGAMRNGLVAALDQDRVQWMMAEAIGAVRMKPTAWDLEDLAEMFVPLAIDLDNIVRRHTHGVPASTLAALRYLVRVGDPARLRSWIAAHPQRNELRKLVGRHDVEDRDAPQAL